MVQCSGKDCNSVNVPFVDTILKRTDGLNQKRKFSQSSQNKYFVTKKRRWTYAWIFQRSISLPSAPVLSETECQTNEKGVCTVFNCPWMYYNSEENNSVNSGIILWIISDKKLNETFRFHKFSVDSKITPEEKPKKCLHLTDSKRTKTIDFANQDFVIKVNKTW